MWVPVRASTHLNPRLGALAGVVCGCALIAKGLGGLDVAAPAFGPWPAVAGADGPPQPLALPAAPAPAVAPVIVRPVRHGGVKRIAGGPQPPAPRAVQPGDEAGRRPPAAGHPRRHAPGGAPPQGRRRPLPAASTVTTQATPVAAAVAPAPPAAVLPVLPVAAVAAPDAVAPAVGTGDGGSATGAAGAPPHGHAYGRDRGAGNARGHRH